MTPVNAASFGKVGWFIGLTFGWLVCLFVSLFGFGGWLVGWLAGRFVVVWFAGWLNMMKHDLFR